MDIDKNKMLDVILRVLGFGVGGVLMISGVVFLFIAQVKLGYSWPQSLKVGSLIMGIGFAAFIVSEGITLVKKIIKLNHEIKLEKINKWKNSVDKVNK